MKSNRPVSRPGQSRRKAQWKQWGLICAFVCLGPSAQAQLFGKDCNKYESAFYSEMPTSKILMWSGAATVVTSLVHADEAKRSGDSQALSLASGLIGVGTGFYGLHHSCSFSTRGLGAQVADVEENPEDTIERRDHLRTVTAQAVAANAIVNILLYSNTKNLNVKSIATIGAVLPIGMLTYYWNHFEVMEPGDDSGISFQVDPVNSMLNVSWTF